MRHKSFILLLIVGLCTISTHPLEVDEALDDLTESVDNLASAMGGASTGGWRSFFGKISNPFKSTTEEESEEEGAIYFGSTGTNKENWRTTDINGVTIELVQGDITDIYNVDAIVNAANPQLDPGGFVSGAIFNAAGVNALKAEIARRKNTGEIPHQLAVGQAVATDSYNLATHNIDFIIHAVGPNFDDNSGLPLSLVGDIYFDALHEASKLGANRIAFSLISAGVYRGPKTLTEIARETWTALKNYAENYIPGSNAVPTVIILVAYDKKKDEFNAYAKEFDTIFGKKKQLVAMER